MFNRPVSTKITFSTPEKVRDRLGHKFVGGVTLFDRRDGCAEIIIDSGLDRNIQKVYLEHESVQLSVLRKCEPGNVDGVLGVAHFSGLEAGYKMARILGVENQYRTIRGEKE